VLLPQVVEEVSQVQGDGDKGRDSVLVARMGMILEAVCKDPPGIQADITEVFVLAASDSSANLSQVDGVFHYLRISIHELGYYEKSWRSCIDKYRRGRKKNNK
jgi:hypothetical protein